MASVTVAPVLKFQDFWTHRSFHNFQQLSLRMVVLRCSDVPLYLRDSDFYRNLDNGDNDEFVLSFEHFKKDTTVRNDADLDHLLSTLRFWGAVCFPETAILFILNSSMEMLDYITTKYGAEFSIVSSIAEVRRSEPNQKMDKAIEGGSLDLVQFLHKEGYQFNEMSAELAAKVGSVPILRHLHEHGHHISPSATKGAAEMGHVNCLQYFRSINIPWHKDVGVIAASCGRTSCLKYVIEQGHEVVKKDIMCLHAAQNGHHECLQYLIDHNLHAPGEYWIRYAADSGNLQCLQLAFNLVQQWPAGIQHSIIIRHNFDCFVYSVVNGCHYTWDDTCSIAGRGYLQHLQYIEGHTGFTLNEFHMQAACAEGHLDCVKFLHEVGCSWGLNPFVRVIERHYDDCLAFMHEHGAAFSSTDCTVAARCGHLRILQYLHTHGAMWGPETCSAAAEHGHLACLMYLHENNCPWDVTTTTAALQHNHQYCYTYAKKRGCPLPPIAKRMVKWVGL